MVREILGEPSWEELYLKKKAEGMPWFYEKLDPDVEREIKARELKQGRFLDMGTGPGTQAIELAKLGFQVTGTDISGAAVKDARKRPGADQVDFRVDDILNSRLENKSFDFILDRGVFHQIDQSEWERYLENIRRILADGGTLLLKCFSVNEPDDKGPRRFSKNDIRNIFTQDFVIESIRDTVYYGSRSPMPKALFAALKKR